MAYWNGYYQNGGGYLPPVEAPAGYRQTYRAMDRNRFLPAYEPHMSRSLSNVVQAPPNNRLVRYAASTGTSKQKSFRGDPQYLRQIFAQFDTDHNGEIDAEELQRALSNGTWTPFNMDTVHMMIGMFDKDRSGAICFEEFGALWKYINDWQAAFRVFDADYSGNIDQEELKNALSTFGYRLTPGFYGLLIARFDRTRSGSLNFDDFIQLCLVLQTSSKSFKDKDKLQKGTITITYEEFLSMAVVLICRMSGRRF